MTAADSKVAGDKHCPLAIKEWRQILEKRGEQMEARGIESARTVAEPKLSDRHAAIFDALIKYQAWQRSEKLGRIIRED